MNKRVEAIFENKQKDIVKWMEDREPIEWICKELNISIATFKARMPEYKGNQGFSKNKYKKQLHITDTKKCERCNKEFTINVFTASKSPSLRRFCSKVCGRAKAAESKVPKRYRTLAKRAYGELKCCVCGFTKIVDIHHADHNHSNNDPKNLIPLCPNHHRMYHSKYVEEVKPFIENFLLGGLSITVVR
jgi:hypothetical protein